ncbi:transmembrane glucosamine N-acetyltransferase NagX [Aliikangiella coralliicola]|uniref:DUF5009 domain-containing protein n=1 Tax=Aliikangiella coralliicola TaxID=2592383 RepID=A0A545UHG8_9GAMM|nr:DUF5009 domain-containing protein [Aliikangiella coralliicola]TQV88921.1 DUF5009 domain-containing protein [Aliikangiella coralliicola]
MKTSSTNNRLLSLDALRGFDMIWILGAEGIFAALFTLTGWELWRVFAEQFKHSQWHGITFYDLIFPLFIFLSGVTLGIAGKSLLGVSTEQRLKVYKKALLRLLLLCFFGVLYNHGWGQGAPVDAEKVRYASVLMRIGVAWFFAALIVWHCNLIAQISIAIGILLTYWFFQVFVAAPSGFSGELVAGESWNSWFDQHFLPGITYQNMSPDPEGILSHIPAIVNALGGAFAGKIIVQSALHTKQKLLFLTGFSATCLLLGYLWSLLLPLNKTLWTSSFTLVSIGWSCVLLIIFYFLIDVLNWRRVGMFFAVIGANAILLYLLSSLFNWQYFINSLLGGLVSRFDNSVGPLLAIVALVLTQWLLAKWLYEKKIFMRV